MALDPRIPLEGKPAQFMTPGDALSLQDLSLQVQQRQAGVQRQQKLMQLMQEPGMFDETGSPSAHGIQRVFQVDPQMGQHFMTARATALGDIGKTQRANILQEARMAAAKAKQQADEARREQNMSKAEKEQYGLFKTLTADIDAAGLAAHDAAVSAGDPPDVVMEKWRDARLAAVSEREASGALKGAGFNDAMISMAKQKIAADTDPNESRERVKTVRQRELETKAALDSPYKTAQQQLNERKLEQGDQRISLSQISQGVRAAQGDRKLDQGDRRLDRQDDQLDAKIAADERKAGIAEETIKLRSEHNKAATDLQRARLAVQGDTAATSAEERERHNRALEEAQTREKDLRGKAYGSVTMNAKGEKLERPPAGYQWKDGGSSLEPIPGGPADKSGKGTTGSVSMNAKGEKMEKAPSGYEWNPDEPGTLRPIKGGPKDVGKTYGSKAERAQYEKPPVGYQWKDGGSSLEPIPGGPADKPAKGTTGSVTMNSKGEKLEKPPTGYQWTDGGAGLEPIPGGPADKPGKPAAAAAAKESAIAGLNRELESGAITQEQHDAMIAKLTAVGKGAAAKGKIPETGDIGFSIDKALERRGWMMDPKGGGLVPWPGGPQDPAMIAKQAAARRAGTTGKMEMSTPGADYAGPPQHGEEYLKQFKPEFADQVRKVARGEVPIELISKTRGQQQQVLSAVLQYQPDWQYKPKPSAGNKGKGNLLSQDALKLVADQYLSGDRGVLVGFGRSPATLAELKNEIASQAKARGMTGKQISSLMAEFEGLKSAQRSLGTRSANIDVAARELDEFAELGKKASIAVPRTGFVPINKLMRLGRAQWSPEQAAFEAANRSIINAFAQVASRSGNATVHNTEEAEVMLNTAQTHEQYMAVIKQLQTEARAAIKATTDTKKGFSRDFSGGQESGGPAAGREPRSPPAPTRAAPGSGAPGPKRETPNSAMPPVKAYSDPEKERRYQEWKKQHGQ